MMDIRFTKSFLKQYWKLQKLQRRRVDEAITLFRHDPFDVSLHNHALRGDMKGQRSLSAGFDLRILFEERDGYAVVIMIAVGTHEEVY